jgi:hypothetical protein
VKFQGVDVGTVKSIGIDPENPRLVVVDLRLRKETPVKTDTRASLAMKGITGVVVIDLNGGDAAARTLVEATPAGKVPEIPSEKTGLKAMPTNCRSWSRKSRPRRCSLPWPGRSGTAEKFSAVGEQTKKVATGVGADRKVGEPLAAAPAPEGTTAFPDACPGACSGAGAGAGADTDARANPAMK